jgi:hypothetical protein
MADIGLDFASSDAFLSPTVSRPSTLYLFSRTEGLFFPFARKGATQGATSYRGRDQCADYREERAIKADKAF